MHRFHRVVSALLGTVLVAGCGGSDDSPSASPRPTTSPDTTAAETPTPVGGLVATIGTNRLYAPNRQLGLGLQNVGDEPIVVRAVQLDSDLFATVPMTERDVLLPPGGRRLVLRLPYGEARCDGDADGSFAALLVVDDGEELRLRAAEGRPGAIGHVHGQECGAAAVRERADIRFGDRWTRDGITITGELLLELRSPGGAVTVDDVVGNVIFTLRMTTSRSPVLRVTDDEPSARVPVTISADRCDPHAVAEFKRPFVFLSWAAVGDEELVPVELEVDGAARTALEELLATCL